MFFLTPLSLQKTWKRRWFVRRTAHLAYYKPSAEYQLHRLLERKDVAYITESRSSGASTHSRRDATRTYYLQTESQERSLGVGDRESVEARGSARPALHGPTLLTSPRRRSRSLDAHASLQPLPLLHASPPSRRAPITSSDSEDASAETHQRTFAVPCHPACSRPGSQGQADRWVKGGLSGYITKMGKRRNGGNGGSSQRRNVEYAGSQ